MSTEGRGHIAHQNDTAYNYMTTKQVSVTDAATEIVTADGTRAKLCLFNLSTATSIYVGNTDSVTTTNGFSLEPRRHIAWPYAGPLYGIVTAATEIVTVAEFLG